MWESYCKNGGVRIKTTIGKVLALYSDSMRHGRVFYAPAYLPPSLSDKKDYLFHKRTCFHYENEYRFIFEKDDHQLPTVLLKVGSMRDFIDEFLVCPSTKERKWVSEAIYALLQQCDFFSVITENNRSENSKNGVQYCGISQLYGLISQELL